MPLFQSIANSYRSFVEKVLPETLKVLEARKLLYTEIKNTKNIPNMGIVK